MWLVSHLPSITGVISQSITEDQTSQVMENSFTPAVQGLWGQCRLDEEDLRQGWPLNRCKRNVDSATEQSFFRLRPFTSLIHRNSELLGIFHLIY
jgi:hypothetical protein